MRNPVNYVLSHAWNLFNNKEPTGEWNRDYGSSSSSRPDRPYTYSTTQKSIVNSIYNRIAMDVSSLDFRHIKLDKDGNYIRTLNTKLNDLFSVEANIDQTGRAFIQDAIHSMCDDGHVALVPITTNHDIEKHNFTIDDIRVGLIVEWMPKHVRVNLYNDETGERQDIVIAKKSVAIIENPLYAVMNEPNSILRRLTDKDRKSVV